MQLKLLGLGALANPAALGLPVRTKVYRANDCRSARVERLGRWTIRAGRRLPVGSRFSRSS